MKIKQIDIDGVANRITSRRYKWRILAWAAAIGVGSSILFHLGDWQAIVTFTILGHSYNVMAGALWFLGLAGVALVGCALWSQRQREEAVSIARQYENNATLFYSTFYPHRFGDTVGCLIQQKTDSKETREITITMLASLIGAGTIGGLMTEDTGGIFCFTPTGIGIGLLGALVIIGSLMIVATLQGKRELMIMREMGYEVKADGRNRIWPIVLTVIVMIVAAILIAMGIRGANPFYLLGGIGLGLASTGYLLFEVYLGAYYKSMKAIELIKVSPQRLEEDTLKCHTPKQNDTGI